MNRTRIEIATIPQELPPPHFDDESTIVSARQVVPIAQAKVAQRSRAVLSVIPILMAAAVFGALGALAVNYYEGRQRGRLVSTPKSETSQPLGRPPASQPQVETSTNSASESAAGALASSASPSPFPEGSPETKNDSATAPPAADSNAPAKSTVPTDSGSKATDSNSTEPGKLIRKRRVLAPAPANNGKPENPPKDKRGAGKIQEIFSGPNPD
ncbi:MAG: hypothetical protein AABM67_05445 [Acidobacteriota bacterium]